MTEFSCVIVGDYPILVSAIESVFQIYRFDLLRVRIKSTSIDAAFDVPSTEWLEEFTSLLTASPPLTRDIIMLESGMPFRAERRSNQVIVWMLDVGTREYARLSLTDREARELHRCALDAFLEPFLQQGGRLENLSDLHLFTLPSETRGE